MSLAVPGLLGPGSGWGPGLQGPGPAVATLTDSETSNLVRWEPTTPGMYESHFVKVNLPADGLALWWRFTIVHGHGGAPRFDVWAILFDVNDPSRSFAIKTPFAPDRVQIAREALRTRYGDNVLEHGASRGALDGNGHTISWDVRWTTPETAFRHFPYEGMYTGAIPRTKVLTPAIDSRFAGSIVVDGRTVTFADARGMQGHNWGERHAEQWVWVHCNAFLEDETAVFEAVSSKIKVAGLETPPLTVLHFQSATDTITVNGLTDLVASRGELLLPAGHGELSWRFRGAHGGRSLEGHVGALPSAFVGLDYPNPDGSSVTCLNSKVADLEVRLMTKRGVWRLDRTLTAKRLSALEIGLRGDTHGVRVHL